MKSKKTIFASLIFLLSLFSFLNGVIFQHKKAYATNWNKLKIVNERCFQNRVDGNYEKAIDSYIEAHKVYPAMETPLMMIERLKEIIKKESI